MAYKRSFRSKRRRYSRRTRKPTVRRLLRYVRFRRPETKVWQDETKGSLNIPGNGLMLNLSPLAQGTANGERIGIWARPKSLAIRMIFDPAELTANSINRVIVFQWNDDYNSPPVVDSILANTNATTYSTAIAPYSIQTRGKFKILYDKQFMLGVTTGDEYNKPFAIKAVIRPKYRIKWTDDTDTHYAQGNIFMLIHSTSPSVASGTSTDLAVQSSWQLTYFDD